MNSKEIYKKHKEILKCYEWVWETEKTNNINGLKYYYCGIKSDFKTDSFKDHVDTHFPDENVYLVTTPYKSILTTKTEIVDEIQKFIGKRDLFIFDVNFKKVISVNTYGTFAKGVIVEFPKSRERKEGSKLDFKIYSNIVEESTEKVAKIIRKPSKILEKKLSKDYGGNMESLWISIELVKSYIEKGKTYKFRFQKRVNEDYSGGKDYYYNVGKYSVIPDFRKLEELPNELICDYIFGLIYDFTKILVEKSKKLNGFNARKFSSDFLKYCNEMGYLLSFEDN